MSDDILSRAKALLSNCVSPATCNGDVCRLSREVLRLSEAAGLAYRAAMERAMAIVDDAPDTYTAKQEIYRAMNEGPKQ